MQTKFLLNGLKLHQNEQDYLEERIQKAKRLIPNFDEEQVFPEIEVQKDKKGFWRVELMIKTPYNLYRADKTAKTLLGAADQTEEALTKQIRRKRDKIKDKRH